MVSQQSTIRRPAEADPSGPREPAGQGRADEPDGSRPTDEARPTDGSRPTDGHRQVPARPNLDRILADPDAPALVFQPIVDLRRGVTAGYEALARFGPDPRDAPHLVFGEADRRGCAAELEARVLRRALAARDHLPERCFLAVNVFPHLLSSPEVAAVWRGADLSRIVLELNEAVDIERATGLRATSQELRDHGAFLAMDDVGSGYAGLRQLTHIRPDFVKLDASLVANIDDDQVKIALTELVGGFASRLNGWVIAEGVERVQELTMLVALGVPLGQGYLLGRPAARWQELDPAVARRIRLLSASSDQSSHIVSLMEPVRISTGDFGRCGQVPDCPPCGHPPAPGDEHAGDHETLGDHSAGDDGSDGGSAIIVSNRCRPVAVRLAGGAGEREPRRIPTSLFALPNEPVTEVARRAMTRPAGCRFDPVIIVTEMGRPLGLVRMERLMLRLADLSAA
ncbi:EAL domain-containing protein [Parafrankia discariae]|uniref:EAL domain-containing protein n=1 Tax=Parafrankia discariae TaxID=365528 RepID=UPI000379B83B|nr:EAL domain-containing protein [Parafrankia discariae]